MILPEEHLQCELDVLHGCLLFLTNLISCHLEIIDIGDTAAVSSSSLSASIVFLRASNRLPASMLTFRSFLAGLGTRELTLNITPGTFSQLDASAAACSWPAP